MNRIGITVNGRTINNPRYRPMHHRPYCNIANSTLCNNCLTRYGDVVSRECGLEINAQKTKGDDDSEGKCDGEHQMCIA